MYTKEQIEQFKRSMIGKQFKHKNGNIYTVTELTNTEAELERQKDHPINVIYMGQNGHKWSRPLSDWDRSFTSIGYSLEAQIDVSVRQLSKLQIDLANGFMTIDEYNEVSELIQEVKQYLVNLV